MVGGNIIRLPFQRHLGNFGKFSGRLSLYSTFRWEENWSSPATFLFPFCLWHMPSETRRDNCKIEPPFHFMYLWINIQRYDDSGEIFFTRLDAIPKMLEDAWITYWQSERTIPLPPRVLFLPLSYFSSLSVWFLTYFGPNDIGYWILYAPHSTFVFIIGYSPHLTALALLLWVCRYISHLAFFSLLSGKECTICQC